MKKFSIATVIAALLSTAIIGVAAPAQAVPHGANAQDTISQLEAEGNHVVVHRLSDRPLSEAVVVGVNECGTVHTTVHDNIHDHTQQHHKAGSVYYLDVR